MLGEDWPRESLDDLIALPNDADLEMFIHLLSLLGRQTRIDRVVALEEFDVITAARLREHFCLSGMPTATARLFRDKGAMGAKAREAGITVPEFVPMLNYDDLRAFMERVPPPWIVKPRSDVSAIGIRKVNDATEVWQALDTLDRRDVTRTCCTTARTVRFRVFFWDSIFIRPVILRSNQ